MLDAGAIMEVHEATPWINSYVIVETVKDGKKNKAVRHEPYLTHTPDDVYYKLANGKYITVIDFKKSFWQFVLDEESSYLSIPQLVEGLGCRKDGRMKSIYSI